MKSILVVTILTLTLMSTAIPMFLTASAASTYTEYNGNLAGASYTVRIPSPIETWNRNLVVYCHGYSHAMPADPLLTSVEGSSDWAAATIAAGAAFAITSNGAGGYCVQQGMDATYQLTQYVKSTYSATGKVYLVGVSMGGNIALLLGEKYPNIYSGVLDVCGVKNATETYNLAAWVGTTDNSAVEAQIQAFNAPIPPYPFGQYTNWMASYRYFCNQVAGDIDAECGGTPSAVPQAYRNIDPLYHTNISIPVITVHGTSDGLVPYVRSLQYQTAIAAANKSSLYRLYPVAGGEHAPSEVLMAAGISHLSELMNFTTVPEFAGSMFAISIIVLAIATVMLSLGKPMKAAKYH
jgi:pimeloyl-ACP methyl ester carboxylesterase